MTRTRPAPVYPYSVRRQTSGGTYTGLTRYIVVRNPGGKRVSEYPPSTELTAWRAADRLNVTHYVAERGCTWTQARDYYILHRLNPLRLASVIPYSGYGETHYSSRTLAEVSNMEGVNERELDAVRLLWCTTCNSVQETSNAKYGRQSAWQCTRCSNLVKCAECREILTVGHQAHNYPVR